MNTQENLDCLTIKFGVLVANRENLIRNIGAIKWSHMVMDTSALLQDAIKANGLTEKEKLLLDKIINEEIQYKGVQ